MNKRNLHIFNDDKFIVGALEQFEKFYPGENIYINYKRNREEKIEQKNGLSILVSDLSRKTSIKQIEAIIYKNGVQNIFIHYLTTAKAILVNKLKSRFDLRIYWIFYGADLYSLLNGNFGYQLLDDEDIYKMSFVRVAKSKILNILYVLKFGSTAFKIKKAFICQLDYFCFWNRFDFVLLNRYFATKAKYRDFVYSNAIQNNFEKNQFINFEDQSIRLLLNNSASITGNHSTIFKKLKNLKSNDNIRKIIIPISYGDNEVKKNTIRTSLQIFGNRAILLTNFLTKDEYFTLIKDVNVAIFGARRQEAAGNIFYLLSRGVKVFLRNQNNMMDFFKENNIKVFSFEDDLNEISDLLPLKKDIAMKNREGIFKLFNENSVATIMKDLIL